MMATFKRRPLMETLRSGSRLWEVHDLGVCDFDKAQSEQQKCIDFQKKTEYNSDYIILSQFNHVLTKGRNFQEKCLLVKEETLEIKEVSVKDVNRGGDVTYHGPGQLMIYPIANLRYYGKDLRRWICALEESVIRFLALYAISAGRSSLNPGVWVEEQKIASIGVGCSQWISYHGIGLNINTDLSYFDMVVPCGLEGVQMTSLQQLLGESVDMNMAQEQYLKSFTAVMNEEVI